MAKLDLPIAVRQLLEPVFQQIPLTELESLLSNFYLRHYARHAVPQRLHLLRHYASLPRAHAAVLALKRADYDILDRIIATDSLHQLDVLRFAFVDTQHALFAYYVEAVRYNPERMASILEILIREDCEQGYPLTKEWIIRTDYLNTALILSAQIGNARTARIAIEQGAVVIQLAAVIVERAQSTTIADDHYNSIESAMQAARARPVTGLALKSCPATVGELVLEVFRRTPVRFYLQTVDRILSPELELFELGKERYPDIPLTVLLTAATEVVRTSNDLLGIIPRLSEQIARYRNSTNAESQ